MVKALIGIAQGLGLGVAADGLGGEAERAALAAPGRRDQQGALYGGPVGPTEALAMDAGRKPSRKRA